MHISEKAATRFDWISAGFAGVWLIFLVFPAASMWANSELALITKITGITLLVLFSGIYLASYGANELIPAKTQWGRTLLWSVLLLLPTLALIPAMGTAVLYLSTYFVAIWAFQNSPSVGLPVGSSVALISAVTMGVYFPEVLRLSGYGFSTGAFFALVVAWLTARGDRQQEREQEMMRAQTSEKIARDVHDILGHSLTVINLKAELAATLVPTDPKRAQNEMQQITALSRTALAEVRATVTRMRSPNFAGELEAARRALDTAGITAHLPAADATLAAANATLFSWVLREGITNVMRHSHAKNCWVTIEPQRIEIMDDGGSADLTEGNGLTGLRRRVAEAGGDLVIETGQRTRLLATMNGDTSPVKDPY